MSDAKVLEKLQKIAMLAKRGVGGEKQNAEAMLRALLVKHGLTLADLDDDEQEPALYWFAAKNEQERGLLFQCLSVVSPADCTTYKSRNKRGKLGVYLLPSEYVELDLLFTIHKREYAKQLKKEQKALFIAYINKNNLFPPSKRDDGESKPSTLTPDELAAIMRLMGRMTPTQVRTAIAA